MKYPFFVQAKLYSLVSLEQQHYQQIIYLSLSFYEKKVESDYNFE